MTIKFLSTVICCILLGVANGENATWSAEEENCIAELKLDKTNIQILSNKAITPYSDTDFNNFLSCYWKKKGAQEENGALNWEIVDKILEDDLRKKSEGLSYLTTVALNMVSKQSAAACKSNHKLEDTHGKTVAKFLNCVSENIQTILIRAGTKGVDN